jgi:hypothetical protein
MTVDTKLYYPYQMKKLDCGKSRLPLDVKVLHKRAFTSYQEAADILTENPLYVGVDCYDNERQQWLHDVKGEVTDCFPTSPPVSAIPIGTGLIAQAPHLNADVTIGKDPATGEPLVRLSTTGFWFKGELVEDAGAAYKAFMEALNCLKR